MIKVDVAKLLELPAEERLELAELLWRSVEPEDEARFLAIPAWQRGVLAERFADLAENPDDEEPWEKVRAEVWPEP